MGYFDIHLNKNLEAVLTFKDGSTYTASKEVVGDHHLKNINVHESEARTTSNLLGLITSNNASFTIIDDKGDLLATKEKAGSGVKVELFEIVNSEGSITPTKKGEYYTDSWDCNMIGRTSNFASISCYDKLSHLGQKELPDLGKLNDMTVKAVLVRLFEKLGLAAGVDYVIESGLDLDILYAVTKGSKVRDTLNEIAQALIARITCDRNGVIRVKPAFKNSSYTIAGTLSERMGSSFNIRNNKDTGNYTRVKVKYVNMSLNETPAVLAMRTGITVGANASTSVILDIPKNTQVIDAVRCRCHWDSDPFAVRCVRYNRTQEGLEVYLENNTSESITVDITVLGKSILSSNAYVFDTTNDDSGNTFEVENIYIQDEATAKKFADNIKSYILNIKNRYKIVAHIDMEIDVGSYIHIESPSQNISGDFYVNGLDFDISNGYRVAIDAIRVS